jgi:aminopeptidase-like protein
VIDLIRDLYLENRAIVGPGYDRALERIARDLPIEILAVPSGEDVWTWRVPNAWDIREAWFEGDGARFADFSEHPLHVWSFSLPFRGRVSREELLRHLTTDETRPHAIPFDFRYYERDWGFSLQHARLAELTAAEYDVVIDTIEALGALKVGEHVLPGESEDSIVVVAHLCHPGQANDDLAGVTVAIEAARRLRGRGLHHTLRVLFVPEQIGTVAYLSRREHLIERLRYGIVAEMLGIDQALALQHSKRGDTAVDRAAVLALRESGLEFVEGRFLEVIVNDEQVLDGPGVDIPTISLSRATPPLQTGDSAAPNFHTGLPYPEYHTSHDTPEIIREDRLEEAVHVLVRTIEILDRDVYPRRGFRGPVHLSRYGLWVDWRVDPALNEQVHHIMWCLEGDKSVSQIALETGLGFDTVLSYLRRFEACDLLAFAPEPWAV